MFKPSPHHFSRMHCQSHWLRNALLALGIAPLSLLFAPAAQALNPGSVSIQLVTDPYLVVDSNSCAGGQGPRATYVGFKVTNTSSSTLTDLRVNLGGFNTAQGFSLSGGQAATQYTGTLTPGASDTVYWYMQYPCTQPLSNTLTVTVSDNNPGVVTGTGTVTTNSTISANAGGLVSSTVLGPGAVVGQIITYDATYSFGNIQLNDRFNLQPAGNIGFNASCFQLVTSEITSSAVPGLNVGSRDQLFYLANSSKGGSGNLVSIRYYFMYLCAGVNTTARPYAAQTSGSTNVKYTGNYDTQTAFSFPAATNPFSITKTASSTTLPNGGTVTYAVTVTNTSNFDAIIDRIVDTLPPGVTYGGIAAGSNVTAANSSTIPTAGATGTISWIGIPFTTYVVPARGSITLRYTANVPATPGSYTNSATAITGQASIGPATATVSSGSADLSITKTDGATTAVPGNPINYTITVTNNGSSTVNTMTVIDNVPATILNPVFTASTGSYNSSTGVWTGLNLAAGQSVSLTLSGTISPTATGTLVNTATVSSNLFDPVLSNNSATDTNTLTPQADLGITKTDGQTETTAGSPITYTMTVTNAGPSTVNSITVNDPVPTAIQNPVFTPSTGTYNSSTGAWTGLNLAAGQSLTLTLRGTLSSSTTGTLTNTATVSTPTGVSDPNTSNNTATDTTLVYAIAPTAGQIVINEVLYAQSGGSAASDNDEFIELYNASAVAVDLSGWRMADGNLIANSTDGTGGFNYAFPAGTILAPGAYAVIWIGNSTPDRQATGAVFQTWLNLSVRLNNNGDDIWLYDSQMRIVDYIAYGSSPEINTPPPAALNLWNAAFQSALANTPGGQSISLTANGQDGNTSACWEHTTSGQASSRCPNYLPTVDTDAVGSRITSVGANNNGSPVAATPRLLLVKRITAINGAPVSGFVDGVDNPASANYVPASHASDDNNPYWPNPAIYLRGVIHGGAIQPGDEMEYTIYFLSSGSAPMTNVTLCDLMPTNTTFIATSFNDLSPLEPNSLPGTDVGIGLALSSGSLPTAPTVYLTNAGDGDRGQFIPPGEPLPASCSGSNTNGAVVVRVVQSPATLPHATAPGSPANSYGFIRFRVRVN